MPSSPRPDDRPLADRFADAQTRTAYLDIRAGLAGGRLTLDEARQRVTAIRPPVFDSGFSDNEKQTLDYEKRQLYAALDALEALKQPSAERFDACVAARNLR